MRSRHEAELLRKKRNEARMMRDRMLTQMYNMAGMNSRGEPKKQGWVSSLAGLTELKVNPILDPDYTFESEAKLTKEELRWML